MPGIERRREKPLDAQAPAAEQTPPAPEAGHAESRQQNAKRQHRQGRVREHRLPEQAEHGYVLQKKQVPKASSGLH